MTEENKEPPKNMFIGAMPETPGIPVSPVTTAIPGGYDIVTFNAEIESVSYRMGYTWTQCNIQEKDEHAEGLPALRFSMVEAAIRPHDGSKPVIFTNCVYKFGTDGRNKSLKIVLQADTKPDGLAELEGKSAAIALVRLPEFP